MNIPNGLTLARIALAPVLILALASHHRDIALAVFCAGMATDVLDGHIARTRGLVSDFGKLMDPAADKLLVGSAFVSLAAIDRLDAAIVVAILSREIAVSALRVVASRRGVVISASSLGKAKTGLQAVAVIALMIVGNPDAAAMHLLVAATTLVTILSGMAYFLSYLSAPVSGDRVAQSASSPG